MLTTGDIAKRLRISRAVVCYAIEKAGIQPVQRAGIVRLFSVEQWPEIVKAINEVTNRAEPVVAAQ